MNESDESRRFDRAYPWMALALAVTIIAPVSAEPAGPPAPVGVESSPAQQAMLDYKRNFGPVPLPAPCQRPKDNEVIVCGGGVDLIGAAVAGVRLVRRWSIGRAHPMPSMRGRRRNDKGSGEQGRSRYDGAENRKMGEQ